MRQIFSIAFLTILEGWRKKLWIVAVVYILILLFCLTFIPTKIENKILLLTNWTISGTYAFTILILVVFGGLTIPDDIDTKRTFMLFSKPMGRVSYITGRFLGLSLLSFFIILLLIFIGAFLINIIYIFSPAKSPVFKPQESVKFDSFIVGQDLVEGGNINVVTQEGKSNFTLKGGLHNACIWQFQNLNPNDFDDNINVKIKLAIKQGQYLLSGSVYVQIVPIRPQNYVGPNPPIFFEKIKLFSNKTSTVQFKKEIIAAAVSKEINTGGIEIRISRINEDDEIVVHSDSITLLKKSGSFTENIFKNLIVIFIKSLIITGFIILGSVMLSGPFSIFFGMFIFFLSNIIYFVKDGMSTFKNVIEMKEEAHHHFHHEVGVEDLPLWVLKFFYNIANGVVSVFPDSTKMDISNKLLSGESSHWNEILQIFYYAIPFILITFLVASFVAVKREYK